MAISLAAGPQAWAKAGSWGWGVLQWAQINSDPHGQLGFHGISQQARHAGWGGETGSLSCWGRSIGQFRGDSSHVSTVDVVTGQAGCSIGLIGSRVSSVLLSLIWE